MKSAIKICGNCVYCISVGDGQAECYRGHNYRPWPIHKTFGAYARRKASECADYAGYAPLDMEELKEIRRYYRSCNGLDSVDGTVETHD